MSFGVSVAAFIHRMHGTDPSLRDSQPYVVTREITDCLVTGHESLITDRMGRATSMTSSRMNPI